MQHKIKAVSGFSQKYNLDKLVYYESFGNPHDAFLRERRMKKWYRKWKVELIENMNPDWKDFAEDWYEKES